MKNISLIFLIILLVNLTADAKHLFKEAEYQNYWCKAHNGITEYNLNDFTRVDCLTENQAVEFDFANKVYERIGQALYYGIKTGKQPACCLIMERGEKDLKYLRRLRKVAYRKGIATYTIKHDVLLKQKLLNVENGIN